VYELSQVRLTGIPNLVEINWRQRSDPEALALKKDLSGGGGGGGDQVLSPEQLWEVITRGSALREVMNRPQVHVPSVFTNDAAQTLDVLGIEAVRKLYIQEMKACMGSVDEAMFQTSVDIMMHRGTITPANRFGAHPLDGPLTKASNEMSTQTLLRAALTHQRENLNGVSAATMVGLPIRIGTGLPQIAWDQDAWFEQLKAHQLEEVKDQELKLRVEHTEPVEHNEPVEMVKNHHGLTGLLSKLSLATGRTYTALEVDEV
jgi:DNA-directed RNA polymerase beta' subunit